MISIANIAISPSNNLIIICMSIIRWGETSETRNPALSFYDVEVSISACYRSLGNLGVNYRSTIPLNYGTKIVIFFEKPSFIERIIEVIV